MDKALYRILVEYALENKVDQWGNTQPSPLLRVMGMWVKENESTLLQLVLDNVKIEELAEMAAKAVYDSLAGSSWIREVNGQRLKNMVEEKVAEALAQEQLQKMRQSPTTN